MTVCIAARAGDFIVLASDRMLTAGDKTFEPHREKIAGVNNSIGILTAGDAGFLSLVMPQVLQTVRSQAGFPSEVLVRDVVYTYVAVFTNERSRAAERVLLMPNGLTLETFRTEQRTMNTDLVRQLSTALIDYQVPDCAVIIAGVDPEGSHIYVVDGINVSGHSDVGFAAIGMGARHAQSQFMLARHAWNSPLSDTLLLTYVAKRRSQAAPTVGAATDMVLVGPGVGESAIIRDDTQSRLEQEYQNIVRAEHSAMNTAKEAIANYVQELANAAVNATGGQLEASAEPVPDPSLPK